MKKVKIAHRDMSISKISEKILKISEEYEKAKEENNKELMEELKKEYEYQKAVLNASENFFAKYDEKEMKDKANYSSDEEEVKRAKWILKNKKEYQDKEDLFDAIIASKSLEEAKEVVEEQKEEEKQSSLVFRKFNKRLAIGITAAVLAIGGLGGLVGLNLKKQNKDKQNPVRQEQTAEMDNITDNLDSTTEQTTKEKTTENVKKKSFNNDEIKTDESYKNLKYKGNGETIDDYAEKNGFPTSGKPEDTVTTKEIPNVSLPSKPEDTEKTEVIPEKVEPTKDETDDKNDKNNNKTDDTKKDNKNDKEKVTVVEKEEKPSDNDPSKIEESKDNNKKDDTKKDDSKKDESTTEDNKPKDTEEKPDFKEPTEIEEDEKDVTYVDGDKNNSNGTTEKPTTEEPKTDESTTEDNTPKDTEEKPDFKDPEIIEEDENDVSYISSLKSNYIALKAAIMTELANMNQTKSVENAGPVLTYTSSKNC